MVSEKEIKYHDGKRTGGGGSRLFVCISSLSKINGSKKPI